MLISTNLVVRKGEQSTRQQVAFGVVYMPNVVDSQGDFMRADEIRKAAYDLMSRGTTDEIDIQHDGKKCGAYIVESFIARKGDEDFPIEGSWVVGIHIPDKDIWELVEKGEIGGLSMEVLAVRRSGVEVGVEAVAKFANGTATGTTHKTGDHEHTYTVKYGPNGEFLGGVTDAGPDGHVHEIKSGVSTELFGDHRHRFSTVEHFDFLAVPDATKKYERETPSYRRRGEPGYNDGSNPVTSVEEHAQARTRANQQNSVSTREGHASVARATARDQRIWVPGYYRTRSGRRVRS